MAARISAYLKNGGLEFVKNTSTNPEDEQLVRGKYDDPNFAFVLPESAPQSLLKDVGDSLVLRGAIYKELKKWRLQHPK